MARTSSDFTQAEINNYANWCFKHGVIYDTVSGPDSPAAYNAEFVTNYFLNIWNQDMTEKNLDLAFPQLQPHLKFWSADEIEYQKLSAQLGQQRRDAIWSFFPGHKLASTYANFNAIGSFFLAHGWNIDRDSFTKAITNIQSGTQGWRGNTTTVEGRPGQRLEFKTDSRPTLESERVKRELDAKAKANTPIRKVTEEERQAAVSHIASNDANDSRSTVRKINPDSPLGRHMQMVHASSAYARQQEAQSSSPYDESYWAGRVTSLLQSIQSTVVRAEVEQFANRLSPDSETKLRSVENFLNRRKTERDLAVSRRV